MIYAANVIPPVDSARNRETRDVVGGKDDGVDGDSLYSFAHANADHIHSPSLVYPTLAAGVPVTAGAIAWNLSAGFTEIVPNAGIGIPFDIHYISVENLDTNATYELWLYAIEVFLGKIRFSKNAVQDGIANAPFQTDIIPADTQIQAKLADSAGGSIATISLVYHAY